MYVRKMVIRFYRNGTVFMYELNLGKNNMFFCVFVFFIFPGQPGGIEDQKPVEVGGRVCKAEGTTLKKASGQETVWPIQTVLSSSI